MTATIGAARHERTESRTAQPNGGRGRLVSTPAGDLEIRIPKLREELLCPRCSSRAVGGPRVVGGDHDRREVRTLRMERELLSRAAAFFAQGRPAEELIFRFIEAENAGFPIRFACRVLGVSPSGFYAWRHRQTHRQRARSPMPR